ncbi:MAG TPA: hypothetical protein VGM88_13085 [Kofleriaceae bacterium]|jgi:hypothetical protein
MRTTTVLISALAISLSSLEVATADRDIPATHADPFARPSDAEAGQQLDRGIKLMETGEWEAAVAAFRVGVTREIDAGEPTAPVFFYNLAQCFRHLHNYDEAIHFYKRFVTDGQPTGKVLETVNGFIEDMKHHQADPAATKEPQQGAGAPAHVPQEAQVSAPISPSSPPTLTAITATNSSRRPVHDWSDPLGWSAVGLGAVGGGVAGYLAFRASSLTDDSNHEPDTLKRGALRDQAHTRRVAAVATGIAGGVVLIAGAVHLSLHTRTVIESHPVTLDVTPTGTGLAVFGSF